MTLLHGKTLSNYPSPDISLHMLSAIFRFVIYGKMGGREQTTLTMATLTEHVTLNTICHCLDESTSRGVREEGAFGLIICESKIYQENILRD